MEEEEERRRIKARQLKVDAWAVAGATYYRGRQYIESLSCFNQGLTANNGESDADRASLHCCKAACYLRLQDWQNAIAEASLSLSVTPDTNQIALIRRCAGLEQAGRIPEAIQDVKDLLQIVEKYQECFNIPEMESILKTLEEKLEDPAAAAAKLAKTECARCGDMMSTARCLVPHQACVRLSTTIQNITSKTSRVQLTTCRCTDCNAVFLIDENNVVKAGLRYCYDDWMHAYHKTQPE